MIIKPETICVKALSSILLIEKVYLPKIKAIYFVLNGNKEIIYIGCTTNLRARFYKHHHEQEFLSINQCSIAWLALNESIYHEELEKMCILYFKPICNKISITEDNMTVSKRIKIRWSTGEVLDGSGRYIGFVSSLALLIQITCNIPISEWNGIAGISTIKAKGLVRFITNLHAEITPQGRNILAMRYRSMTSETLEAVLNPNLPFRQFYLPDNS